MTGPASPREHLVALTSLAPRLLRGLWAGGVAFATGLIVTVVVVTSSSRLYRSEAVVIYERGFQANAVVSESDVSRSMATRLHDMLWSRQRLESLIKERKLYRKLVDKHGLGEAIDEMRKHLNVSGREGNTYRVAYEGESRDLAKGVLDDLLAGVVEDDKQRRAHEVVDAKRFLDTEREHANDDLHAKEGTLATFLTKHPQLAGEAGGGAASAGGMIRAADRDRAAATAGGDATGLELQAAQLEESLAASGARVPGSTEIPADPRLSEAHNRAQLDLETARRDLAEKESHLTNEHPDVKQAILRAKVAEGVERRAAAAMAASRAAAAPVEGAPPAGSGEGARSEALRHALAAVRQQIATIRGRSAPRVEVPKTTSSVVEIDTEWTRINRDVSEARERVSQLDGKQFQVQLAATLMEGGLGGRLLIADPPFRPNRPIAGERSKIVAVGVSGAAVLALLVMGLFALFDDRLYALRDVEGILDDGIVVVVPSVPRRLPAKSGQTSADTKGPGSTGG